MASLLRRYPILIALAALAALLAVIVAWEIAARVGSGSSLGSRTVRRAAPFEAKLLTPPPVAQADEQYPEFTARPLWTPTRRPAPAAAAPSTYTPGQFVLQGVIVAGNSRTAMLREKSNGRLHRVEAGKQLNGITVAEISPDSVTLSQGADREVVPLQVQKAAPPPGPGTPGGPPPVPQAAFGPAPVQPQAQPVPAPHVPPGAAAGPFPSANHPPGPFAPGTPPASPVPIPEAAALAGQAATTNPLSAEELLARRRARRGQQTQ
jgi:general secretion pathway protein N